MLRWSNVSFPLVMLVLAIAAGCATTAPVDPPEPSELLYEGDDPEQPTSASEQATSASELTTSASEQTTSASEQTTSASEQTGSATAGGPSAKGISDRNIGLSTYRFGLRQAIEWALAQNLSLMNARDRVARSSFNVRAAAAEFEVKITPTADASISGGSGGADAGRGVGLDIAKKTGIGTRLGISGDTTKTGDTHTTGVAFSLTQPLLRGLGRTVNEDSILDAKFNLLSSRRSFVESREDLIVSVVRGFYEIIRQREVLALNEKSAERTRRHLNAAQARERVGLASRIDVLRAEIQLRQAEDNLLVARQGYGDAVDRLRILLGFGPQDDVQIDSDPSYEEFEVGGEMAIFLAMTNRLDLATSRDQIDQARRNLKVAKNNTLPQLDLVFGYQQFGSGATFSDSSDLSESMWSIGLATSTDIWRTAERAGYEQAKLDLAGAERNYRLFKDTVVREVKDALRSMEKNRKRITIQKADMDHAMQKLKLARMKFDRGLADNFDLIDAEEEIIRAETNYISSVTDYIVSQVVVKRAIGTLVERPAHLLR